MEGQAVAGAPVTILAVVVVEVADSLDLHQNVLFFTICFLRYILLIAASTLV